MPWPLKLLHLKNMNKRKISYYLLIFCSLFVLALPLLARAGGAGDWSDSGGGDGGGLDVIIYLIFRLLPFPYNFIAIAALIVGYHFFKKSQKGKSIYNSIPSEVQARPAAQVAGYNAFLQRNPGFSEQNFLQKVRTAFTSIQEAWAAGNISPVRRYISDGVYQRFFTQLQMMTLLRQTNTLNEIQVQNVRIDKVESDGVFDVLHVAVQALIDDRFISELDERLNSGGREQFVEYWSFIRKGRRDTPEAKDIYSSTSCPNCGSPLPADMTDLAKCSHCGSMVNSGEFDWVLAEITQAHDYVRLRSKAFASQSLQQKVNEIQLRDSGFSPQVIEDKVSNGYLQILTAHVFNDITRARRFLSDQMFESLKDAVTQTSHIYNRLYLNEVVLVAVEELETSLRLFVFIRSSFQRVSKADETVTIIDHAVFSKDEVVVLTRDKDVELAKGSLYAHACPSCGAPVEDSLDTKCGYCGAVFNSGSYDWVIDGIWSVEKYQQHLQSASVQGTSTDKLEKQFKTKDYVLNNLMVVLAADGHISPEEQAFALSMAKKWGYKPEKIHGLMQEALAGRLSIIMPQKQKAYPKIIKMLERAAAVDNNISPEETAVINQIKSQYNQEV